MYTSFAMYKMQSFYTVQQKTLLKELTTDIYKQALGHIEIKPLLNLSIISAL